MSQQNQIVSCKWLRQQLDNPQLVIVDCRFQLAAPDWGYRQYLQSHIPGAYYLDLNRDLSSPVQNHGGRHPLPDIDRFTARLTEMGIMGNETMVIAYDDSRFAFAARLWWLLRYLGHDRIALLDGGWQGWLEQDYPTSRSIPEPKKGSFLSLPQKDWIVERATVIAAQNMPSVIVVDSRDRDRYAGEREPIDPIAGHIPGAVNSPWKNVSDEAGYLLPLSTQQRLWSPYQQAEDIIVYCGSGVTACVNLFSLKLVGMEQAKLYPGGWSDWCSYL